MFLYTANFINVFVCIAIGEEEAIFLLVRARRVKFFLPIRRFHECGNIASKHACVFDSYCKLTALHARTLVLGEVFSRVQNYSKHCVFVADGTREH